MVIEDATVNPFKSECSKLTQKKNKTTHDWVGKMIHSELCKNMKYDHIDKCYIHKPKPVLKYICTKFSGIMIDGSSNLCKMNTRKIINIT